MPAQGWIPISWVLQLISISLVFKIVEWKTYETSQESASMERVSKLLLQRFNSGKINERNRISFPSSLSTSNLRISTRGRNAAKLGHLHRHHPLLCLYSLRGCLQASQEKLPTTSRNVLSPPVQPRAYWAMGRSLQHAPGTALTFHFYFYSLESSASRQTLPFIIPSISWSTSRFGCLVSATQYSSKITYTSVNSIYKSVTA